MGSFSDQTDCRLAPAGPFLSSHSGLRQLRRTRQPAWQRAQSGRAAASGSPPLGRCPLPRGSGRTTPRGMKKGECSPPGPQLLGQQEAESSSCGPRTLEFWLGAALRGHRTGPRKALQPLGLRQQCLEAWAAGKGKVTSLPPGICCLEASPWRPEGSGWVKIANPRGCKFQELESEKREEYMFLSLTRTETPSWRLVREGHGAPRSPLVISVSQEPSGDCPHSGYTQAPNRGHLQADGFWCGIESCSTGCPFLRKGKWPACWRAAS